MPESTDIGTDAMTTRGYEPPYCSQHSCFLDNKVGQLGAFLRVFEGHALTVAAISIIDSTDHAVIRVVTSNGELAGRLLSRNEVSFSETPILAVEVNEQHSLRDMCQLLTAAEVSIHYCYPMLVRPRGHAVVALHTDDQHLSAQILRRKLYTLLGENELGENRTGSDPLDSDPGNN